MMNISINTDINNDGYILLRNVLTKNDLEYGLSSIVDNKVDYFIMKQYIDNVFFPKIKKTSNIITDPHYVKFRVSNNNNSTDASTFHSDIYNTKTTRLYNYRQKPRKEHQCILRFLLRTFLQFCMGYVSLK